MTLQPGTQIGPYEVIALLGTGGMGEVYRATDPRLGRDVAIKVLPEAKRGSPERGARLEREARLLASINHPNIATIHGLESHGGSSAIVMELVDGPSLGDLIARGNLGLAESTRIASQIADGMSSAHARGIVHRDLKPSNVRVAPDGRVKVLDLGLAKMVVSDSDPAAGRTAREDAETLAVETREGTVLGTAAYMSPEQAVGAPVDARTDVWAFGAVLFEMLSGQRAFPGRTITETLAAVLRGAVDWHALPADVPREVRLVLERCLVREASGRSSDLGEARDALWPFADAGFVATPHVAGLSDRFPPLASLNAVPNNLPTQLTDFIGRQVELDDATSALGGTRLLTILAPGGAGKTRLAIQVAADLAGDFPDGVFFVDLAPISSPTDIIQTVAESLGIALSTEEDLRTQLLAYLAGKTQLLVFDNFEHLAADADLVAEILKGAPFVKVIATSRSKLNIKGETVMTLSGLETDWETADAAFEAGSVRLFIDAAKRADASFSLSVGDLEPLGRILHIVGGMPLGIELAAAWVGMLPIGDIAAEIARSLDFLESEIGGVPDRHHSVRAVFDYSWSMLSEDERRMCSALSVFRGGFTRQAAETVAGASLRNLANLAGKSLLIRDPVSGRYDSHELLRQYAEAALREDAARWDATKTAHARFYADLAAHAEELIPLSDQKQAIRIVEDDLDNIRSAFRYSLAEGDAAGARKFLIGFWFLYEIRGWHQAAVGLFGELLDALEADSGDEATEIARTAASGMQAWFMGLLGQPEAALDQAAEAAARLATLPDLPAHLMAVMSQCGALGYLSRWEEERAVSAEGARIADEAGEEWWTAQMWAWQVLPELRLGSIDIATRLLDEGLAVLSRRGDHRVRSWTLMAKAIYTSMQGRVQEAIDVFKSVVESAKGIGYRRVTQSGLQLLGEAQIAAGDFEAAQATFLETLAMSEQMGSVVEMAGTLTSIAHVRAQMGRKEEAVEVLASVLADPVCCRSNRFDDVPVGETATHLLAELERELDAEMYTAAYARGSATSLEAAAKELLAT